VSAGKSIAQRSPNAAIILLHPSSVCHSRAKKEEEVGANFNRSPGRFGIVHCF
jgi:hypothetical protein